MRYPRVMELRKLHEELWSKLAGGEISSLERSSRSKANVRELARLIELHRSLKNFDRCFAIGREAERRFPNSWILKLAIGKALYHRYLGRRSKGDGMKAAEYLRQARVLNPECERVLLYLAALLFELGQRAEAAEVADELVAIAPKNERARRLRARLSETPIGIQAPTGARRAPGIKLTPDKELLDGLMAKLQEEEAVYGAFIFNAQGELTHRHMVPNEHFTMDGHEQAIKTLAGAAEGASQRIGIGQLQSCAIEGDPWRIYYSDISGGTLAVLASRAFTAESFNNIASRFSMDVVNR